MSFKVKERLVFPGLCFLQLLWLSCYSFCIFSCCFFYCSIIRAFLICDWNLCIAATSR